METPLLSTMVVLYNTNLRFDTTKLAECLPIDETIIKVEKRGLVKKGESSRDKIKHRSKKETKPVSNTGFGHNSITLVLLNDGAGTLPKKEITIKVFQNGVFHLTGVLDPKYDEDSMRILMHTLDVHCRESFLAPIETPEITARRVVLMNYTSRLSSNETVPRQALHMAIRNAHLPDVVSYYDPDVYPGVKIHIGSEKWTVKIFRTGKIILTGITRAEDCAILIERLLSLFALVLPQMLKPASTSKTTVLPLEHLKTRAT
jgi:hypothetical protein